MANYIFESTTQAQAAGFTSADYLVFINGSTSAQNISVTPATGPANDTSNASDFGVVLTAGAQTLTFNSDAISGASTANHLIFNNGSNLLIGHNSTTTSDGLTSTSTASATAAGTVVYGLAGDDSLAGGQGNDYLYGGVGADTIVAGNGNNHIYGNAATTTQGATDGADSIVAGTGNNYINGNAGTDTITVGSTTSTGFNRVFGGGDSDTITINGALGSHAAVNGNLGADAITDSSTGTNTLRGGQGDDIITITGASRDVVQGDLGDDTIHVSGSAGHVVIATGGAGADVFDFSSVGAGVAATLNATGAVATTGGTTYYQEITDFAVGTDHIELATAPTTADAVGHSATVFANVSDAQIYAQTQLTGTTTVSALSVGSTSDTYLFYHDMSTTTADGIIHLDGVTASSVTNTSFSGLVD